MSNGSEHFDDIDCRLVIADLFPYLDNEVDAEKRSLIERHLNGCQGCHARAEFERALRSKVQQLGGSKAPPSLRRRIAAMLNRK